MSNRSKALLHMLAAIVLAGVVMSEAFGYTADELRKLCNGAIKCEDNPASCRQQDLVDAGKCYGYLAGFWHGHFYGMADVARFTEPKEVWTSSEKLEQKYSQFCMPERVTQRQLIEVLIKYLNDHPDELHGPAPSSLSMSWGDAFPCE